MKNCSSFLKRIKVSSVLLLPLIFFVPVQSQAATLDDLLKEIRDTREQLINFLKSAKDLYVDYMFEENPSYPATVAANTAKIISASTQEKVQELAGTDTRNALTQSNLYQKTTQLARLPASDSAPSSPTKSSTPSLFGEKKETNISEGDVNFNVASLLGPSVYSTDAERNAATRFIQFSTSMLDPLTGINMSELTEAQQKHLNDTAEGREFRVYLRSLVAQRSIAMSNLLRMYTERLPVANLAEEAGMPTDKEKKDASPLEVQEYKATRRVNSPEWYKSMSKAAPFTVQRETLYVLAEMREQLFRMQQDNERILLMLSIMELQNIQTNKVLDKEKAGLGHQVLGG